MLFFQSSPVSSLSLSSRTDARTERREKKKKKKKKKKSSLEKEIKNNGAEGVHDNEEALASASASAFVVVVVACLRWTKVRQTYARRMECGSIQDEGSSERQQQVRFRSA